MLDGLREASAQCRRPPGSTGPAPGRRSQLERTVERINSLQQEQQELRSAGLRTAGGWGWIRIPADGKGADQGAGGGAGRGGPTTRRRPMRSRRSWSPVYRQVEVKMQDMTPQMEAAAREEYERYQSLHGQGWGAPGEIEALADLAGENLALTQSVMREAEDVMDYIDSWEGEEDEELDEDALWRAGAPAYGGICGPDSGLRPRHGGQGEAVLPGKYREDRRGWPAGSGAAGGERPSPGRRCWGASCRPPGEAPPAPPAASPSGCSPRSTAGQFFRAFPGRGSGERDGHGLSDGVSGLRGDGGPGKTWGRRRPGSWPCGRGLNLIHILGDAGKRAQGQGAGGGDRGGLRPSAPGGGGGRAGDGRVGAGGSPWRM